MASPPHIPQLNIPRKRTSISGSVAGGAKKRKPSQLRNQFSPTTDTVGSPLRYSRSPSVDSVATTSVVNGAGGRKRKRKNDGDNLSVTGSSIRGGGGRRGDARSATGVEGQGEQDGGEEEEEDDLEEEMDAVLEGGKVTEATKKQEKEHERILMEAMDPNQADRYATYRRIRLKREIVRKLVNQTLSQSVPQPVIIAVTSYSKGFIGELVDRALTVRDEWAAVRTHLPNPNIQPGVLHIGFGQPKAHREGTKPSDIDIGQAGLYPYQVKRDEEYLVKVDENKSLDERLKMCDKGPLTPAHLREALRRYKKDRDGGGAGFAGLSLDGPERVAGRMGGKRLFR